MATPGMFVTLVAKFMIPDMVYSHTTRDYTICEVISNVSFM